MTAIWQVVMGAKAQSGEDCQRDRDRETRREYQRGEPGGREQAKRGYCQLAGRVGGRSP